MIATTAKPAPIQDIAVAWNDGNQHFVETNTNTYGEGFIGRYPLELHTNHQPKVGAHNGGTEIRNALVGAANKNNAVLDAAGGQRNVAFGGTVGFPSAGQFQIGIYRGPSAGDTESTQLFSGDLKTAPAGILDVIKAASVAAASANAIQ